MHEAHKLVVDLAKSRELPSAEAAARHLEAIEAQARREAIDREERRQRERMATAAGEPLAAIDASGAIGIPMRFQNRAVDDIAACCPAHQRVIDIAKRYVGNWPEVRRRGNSLVFWGEVGTTKTVIATAIAQDVARRGARSLYTTINALMLRVKETWREGASDERETAAYSAFVLPDLLLIDEVGRQKGTATEQLILAQVIDRRHGDMKPTIVLSNLDPNGIKERVGEAGMSRLNQGGMCLHFNWPDQRAAERAP